MPILPRKLLPVAILCSRTRRHPPGLSPAIPRPLQVRVGRRGSVKTKEDFTCTFMRPRPRSASAGEGGGPP